MSSEEEKDNKTHETLEKEAQDIPSFSNEQQSQEIGSSSSQKTFTAELMMMVYSLGDDKNPFKETVDALEDAVIQFIEMVTLHACCQTRGSCQLSTEHVLHVIRHDKRKYARVKQLLSVNEELKKARKAFEF